MKKFDNIFLAVAIIIAISMCAVVINWLGWVGITITIGAGVIFGIGLISIWCANKK